MTVATENNVISTESTLGDLVAHKPGRAKVFEKLGLDFCCGGKQTLAQACQEKGIAADTVLTVLLAAEAGADDSTSQQTDWTKVSLGDIAEHIVQTHHAYLRQELPRISEMTQKLAQVHGDKHPWLSELGEVFSAFAKGMDEHSKEEQTQVFPMIKSIESGTWQQDPQEVRDSIGKLIKEHMGAGQALEKMRQLSDGFTTPADGCGTFRFTMESLARLEKDTHTHIHLENSVLFPRAVEIQERKQAQA